MQRGTLEIITGPMFAGKTTELIRRQHRLNTIGRRILLVNHQSNTRHDATGQSIVSHDATRAQGSPVVVVRLLDSVRTRASYRSLYHSAQIIMVDEAQFFEDLYGTVLQMVERDGKHVVLSGLMADAQRNLFGDVHQLVHHADSFTLLRALCKQCGDGTPGIYTRKLRNVAQTIGGADLYETLCRQHYCEVIRTDALE